MPTKLPTIIASRYRIIREIGRGGMGVVYLVKHQNTGEYHAIKVLHESEVSRGETLERFKREMRLPAKIRSDYVARITDADVSPELGGAPFLVMELLNGCDIGKILTKSGARRPDEVAWIIGQAAKAIEKAHAIDIVHRDLKPENLFIHIREDGSFITKVLDFGIAKVKDDIRRTPSASGLRHASTQSAIGTPLYMSPEQARGPSPEEPPIGPACDIWSMGMVAFELLTGVPYWQADNPMQLLGRIFFATLTPPSQRSPLLTRKFDHWFARSCDRNPGNRWVSANKQFDALLDALNLREMPAEIPATLAQQVISLTPLHLEDVAQNEPSLFRIVSPKRASSHRTLVGAERPSSVRSGTADAIPSAITELPTAKFDAQRHPLPLRDTAPDADAVPSAITELPTAKFDAQRHPLPLRDTIPDAPSDALLAACDNAPTPINDLPTEPFDPHKHRAALAAVAPSPAAGPARSGSADDNSPASVTDAPTRALPPRSHAPLTLPGAALNHGPSVASSPPASRGGRRELAGPPSPANAQLTAARQLPQWFVFTAGFFVGLLFLVFVLTAR